jgi:hypothetical protein
MPVADTHGPVGQRDLSACRSRFPEQESGAGRRVYLLAVMHFEDLDIPFLAEGRSDLADHAREDIDAERHVARLNDAGVLRRRLELREIGIGEPSRSDHVDDAGLSREAGERDARGGRREVEDAIRLRERGPRIGGNRHPRVAAAGEQSRVLPDRERAFALDGADEATAVGVDHRLDKGASHAPGGASHHEPHLGHDLRLRSVASV